MLSPLARDPHGSPFDLPAEAAFWRVRRHTGGRPSTVLGPDGEPLFVSISADRQELRAYGCTGSIRLEAVDTDYRPVQAPVAFVELGAAEENAVRQVEAPPVMHDFMRASFESMTRTMEAMQRAQVERERALAQKERALTDAQVAMQRSHTELMVALLDRATNKPQDALAVVKQQIAVDRILEERAGGGSFRNAGLLPPASGVETTNDNSTGFAKWAGALLPLAPMVADVVAKTLAKDDDTKADDIRRNVGAVADAVGGVIQQTAGADAQSAASDGSIRIIPSRALRQVLALLDDQEAEALLNYLYECTDADDIAIEQQAEALTDVNARLAWVRALIPSLQERLPNEPVAQPEAPSTIGGTLSVPPSLFPVLAQLSDEERLIGGQILSALDRATVEKFTASLAAMSPQDALAAVREAIDEAKRRSASVAQRAVASVLAASGKGGVT